MLKDDSFLADIKRFQYYLSQASAFGRAMQDLIKLAAFYFPDKLDLQQLVKSPVHNCSGIIFIRCIFEKATPVSNAQLSSCLHCFYIKGYSIDLQHISLSILFKHIQDVLWT